MLIIFEYEKKYDEKFPFSHVTLYKYIEHGVFDEEDSEIKKKLPFKGFNFVENSWWNKKNHQYDNLKTNFV